MRFLSRGASLAVLSMALIVVVRAASGDELPTVHVTKTPTCGCCAAWVDHLEDSGFSVVVRDVPQDSLEAFKRSVGIAARHRSCHTARVADYVVEGHVASREIVRLLTEHPDTLGLAVPGMPLGSPGMDFDDRRQRYATLLIMRDGSERVFAEHE